MIQRISLLWFTKGLPEADRRRLAAEARRLLSAIPVVRRLEIGLQTDPQAGFDLSIVALTDSPADAERYVAHPAHRECFETALGPHLGGQKAYNFDLLADSAEAR